MTVVMKLLVLAFGVISIPSMGLLGAKQRDVPGTTVAWEQSQSVSVRLSIKGHELNAESVVAECFIEGPMPAGVRSKRT